MTAATIFRSKPPARGGAAAGVLSRGIGEPRGPEQSPGRERWQRAAQPARQPAQAIPAQGRRPVVKVLGKGPPHADHSAPEVALARELFNW